MNPDKMKYHIFQIFQKIAVHKLIIDFFSQ